MRVLIVDDEPLVRKGIVSMFASGFPDVEIVGEAGNGEAARQMIEKTAPDLVLTDIVMPKLDGIELIKWLLGYAPQIKTVVLSCHQDFHFVKQAFLFGAVDYILKYDVDETTMRQVLDKVEALIAQQNAPVVPDVDEAVVHDSDAALIRSALLKEMLFSKVSDEGRLLVQCRAHAMGISCIEPARIACLELDRAAENMSRDRTRFVSEFLSVIGEVLHGLVDYELYYEGNFRVYMVIQPQENRRSGEEISAVVKQLQRFVKRYFSMTLSCGISAEGHNFKHYPKLREQAAAAVEKKFFIGTESLCYFEEMDAADATDTQEIDTLKARIVDEILHERFSRAVALEEELYQRLKTGVGYTAMQAKLIYISVLEHFLTQFDERVESLNDINKKIFACEFLSDLHVDIARRAADIADGRVDIINVSECSQGVRNAVSYINMYYADREVSLNRVARHSGYTSSYLSRLFKQETGIGIIDYLNAVRIYNAKMLLGNANAKVYKVAESVGYNNYNYFSKMFKKIEGVSPSEYTAEGQV